MVWEEGRGNASHNNGADTRLVSEGIAKSVKGEQTNHERPPPEKNENTGLRLNLHAHHSFGVYTSRELPRAVLL